MASAWMEAYNGACETIQIIEKAQCGQCGGFGYINPDGHHIAGRDKQYDVKCEACAGTGFKQNLTLEGLI